MSPPSHEYYQDHGYEDVAVEQPRIEPAGNGKVSLVYPITEGQQYHVGNVSVSGALVYTTDQVAGRLKTRPGNVFSPQDLRDDTKSVGDLYGSRGYIDMNATAETTAAGNHVINVEYKIDEGTQSYINQVNIEGNKHTKDKVIRREMAVNPGEVYDTQLIDVSKITPREPRLFQQGPRRPDLPQRYRHPGTQGRERPGR